MPRGSAWQPWQAALIWPSHAFQVQAKEDPASKLWDCIWIR